MLVPDQNFWDVFKATNGALSTCESVAIMNLAAMCPPNGLACELGVYKGKSAMSAMAAGNFNEFHLVDTEFEKEILTSEVSASLIAAVPNHCRVAFVIGSSLDYLGAADCKFSYVFVDSGDHQSLPMAEVKLLEDKMVDGGIIVFHDYGSQFLQVNDAYDYLLGTWKYEGVKIEWQQIIDYVGENKLEQNNISWHHSELEFPCFVGALKRK
jgi:hypothetical protein